MWTAAWVMQYLDLSRHESNELLEGQYCNRSPSKARRRLCGRLSAKLESAIAGEVSCALPAPTDPMCDARTEQIEARFERCLIDFSLALARLLELNPTQRESAFQRLLHRAEL